MINRIHCRNYGPIQSLTKNGFILPYKGLSTYVEHNFIARLAWMLLEYLWEVLLIEDGTSEFLRGFRGKVLQFYFASLSPRFVQGRFQGKSQPRFDAAMCWARRSIPPRRKQRGSLAFSHGSFISIRATIVIGVRWHGMGQYRGQEELPQVDQ